LGADNVPADKQGAIPALKAEVLKRSPEATDIQVRYDGTYRRVLLEEFRPCDFQGKGQAHGHAYSQVSLRFDDTLTNVSQVDFQLGSDCGAMYCFWCQAKPRWVPLRTEAPMIGIPNQETPDIKLSDELLTAIRKVVQNPEQEWSLPTDSPK
jgi:hypothetical protein